MAEPIIDYMSTQWATYEEKISPLGDAILDWARPDNFGPSPAELGQWPFQKFSVAFAVALAYLGFVYVGSVVMTPLEPFGKSLYPYKFVYNLIQVMLCSYMCIEAGLQAYQNGYSIVPCNPFDTKNPPIGQVLYIFYLSKILDFLDTVFIILGKKWQQLSFLHVYHHTSIFLFYWLNLHVGFDGDIYLTILLNGFIHTVMYTYYFVSMHTQNVWWKEFLTLSQMVQFVAMNAQALWLLYSGCTSFPRNLVVGYLYYILSMLALFGMFYIKSYKRTALVAVKDASGKVEKVRVEKIEKELKAAMPALEHVVCVGEGQSSLSAILSLKTKPNSSELSAVALAAGVDSSATTTTEACTQAAWKQYCQAGINKVNNVRSKDVGKVKSFFIAGQSFSSAGGELTTGGKLDRKGISTKYASEIAALYK